MGLYLLCKHSFKNISFFTVTSLQLYLSISNNYEFLRNQKIIRLRLPNTTVCPGCSDPFYIVCQLYEMGHYFLDTQYILNMTPCLGVCVEKGNQILGQSSSMLAYSLSKQATTTAGQGPSIIDASSLRYSLKHGIYIINGPSIYL